MQCGFIAGSMSLATAALPMPGVTIFHQRTVQWEVIELSILLDFDEIAGEFEFARTNRPYVRSRESRPTLPTVSFSAGNETVALVEARLSAVIGRESETMPGTENGTVPIASQRPATANRPDRPGGRAIQSDARAST